jgi:hypothetical protein
MQQVMVHVGLMGRRVAARPKEIKSEIVPVKKEGGPEAAPIALEAI